ncbi:hypothetical protein [Litorivivens sp.]|uniref:hypothetical protein n=1 Tax=Litorivivens sp. TaxID=2020868 RepID=UPI003569471A
MKKRIPAEDMDGMILGAMEHSKSYTSVDIASALGIGRYTAQTALKRLADSGKVCARVISRKTNALAYTKAASAMDILSHRWSEDDLGILFQKQGKKID